MSRTQWPTWVKAHQLSKKLQQPLIVLVSHFVGFPRRSRLGLRRNTGAQRRKSEAVTQAGGPSEQFFGSFNYTAAKLKEKGIVVDMANVGVSNKMIKITISSEETGIFFVNASVMGQAPYEPERIELVDLLQKQYEGIPTMKFFEGACIVNINLLVFLINKKFYNR
jgi:hypothetical protein